MVKYSFAQSRWHDRGPLLDGWQEGMSASGGLMGWGDALSVDAVLDMTAEDIADHHVRPKLMPRMAGRSEAIIQLDFEHPIHPSWLPELGPDFLGRVARAHDRRARIVRELMEEAGIKPTIIAWWGRRHWQTHPTTGDNTSLIVMSQLRDLGAFRNCDGVAYRVYPPCLPDDPRWGKIYDVCLNGHRAAETVFGPHAFLLPMFSWRTVGGGGPPGGHSLEDAIDEMAGIGNDIAGHAGFWAARPVLTIMGQHGEGN